MTNTSKSLKTLHSFFKTKGDISSTSNANTTAPLVVDHPLEHVNQQSSQSEVEERPHKFQRIGNVEVGTPFERDPGLRIQICEHPINQRDEVRRAYIKAGAYQPRIKEYPLSSDGKQNRRFKSSWFDQFSWLEYSPTTDSAYCFPCFIFETNPPKRPSFTIEGFKNWKRVNNGQKCAFVSHIGTPCGPHMFAVNSCRDLIKSGQNIDKVILNQSKVVVQQSRLRLEGTIDVVRLLAFQTCAFRGHDESLHSANRGNFLTTVKLLKKWNKDYKEAVDNAPGNAKYTSPDIQKEILHIIANQVKKKIREEIGDAKFCILVDEALDESHTEQMAIVLRFVDVKGLVRERFFSVVGVENTTALTLKNEICKVLTHYDLHVENMRGQGYDGASNMRGAWKGLQALFKEDCPFAYYVHCFAHRLQLALVEAAKDERDIWSFFSMLSTIVNIFSTSPKCHNELRSIKGYEVEMKIATGDLETGRGLNQMESLQRPGATRWSSHFGAVNRLIHMYDATCKVLELITKHSTKSKYNGEAKGAYNAMKQYEFVFILHLMNSMMGITEVLCQALQQKSQDIVNAMCLVSSSKKLLQELKESGWNAFLIKVKLFCEEHHVEIPDMGARYLKGSGRSCQQHDHITYEHHYHFDIFNEAINFQLQELNNRFSETAMELLTLSSALDPRDGFKAFNIDDICLLAEKFYPQDFTDQEIHILRGQLQHYQIDIPCDDHFKTMSRISEVCQALVERKKCYGLIDRLFRLVLTLPVSTATTERAFSAMNLVKTPLRNKMGDGFLADCMTIFIEREFAETIESDLIIDEFEAIKDRRVKLH